MTERAAFIHPGVAFRAALALMVAASMAASACGGSEQDDIKNIQATATAAARDRPSPAATPDPVQAYRQKITAAGQRLSGAADKLHKDMLAAAESQADPKWPAILTADTDEVIAAVAAVQALAPPNDKYAAFAAELNEVAAKLDNGAKLLKKAIPTADQEIGAQAFFAVDEGKTKLPAALAALPPQ